MLEIKSSVLSCLKLSIAIESGDSRFDILAPERREYTLEFPITAVIASEKATGKDLKSLQGWLNLETKDLPAVIEAGLAKHHPGLQPAEVTSIIDSLTLESIDEVHYALCHLAFPKLMAQIEERRKQGSLPNANSQDVR